VRCCPEREIKKRRKRKRKKKVVEISGKDDQLECR
jgi:hypothetical protein